MTDKPEPVQAYARIAGVLLLLSMTAGFFGEMYVPSKIVVAADAAATARNLQTPLFRLGFASYLIEAISDVGLALLLYLLLRRVRNDVALLAAFFGLVSTATFATAQMIYFASTLVLREADYLQAFTPEQRNALAMLAVRTYGLGAGILMVFYGIATFLRGWLMYRSRYLPKWLGALLMLAGTGFVGRNFLLLLAPAYASNLLLAPMFLAALSMMLWFLFKGVDVAKWNEAS